MTTPKIYGAIATAMAEIGAVQKSKRNQQQGFQYRGIDDVMNALYPVLSRHGLFLAPEVLEHTREERQTRSGGNLIYSILKIRYTVYADDGSSVSATVIGEGMDSADKSSNKAMSVAMKYALFQLFCIPTEEMKEMDDRMDDPDAESPPESEPKSEPKSKPESKPKSEPKSEPKKPALICVSCKKPITGLELNNGETRTAQQVVEYSKKESGAQMCYKCLKRWQNGEA